MPLKRYYETSKFNLLIAVFILVTYRMTQILGERRMEFLGIFCKMAINSLRSPESYN